MAVKLVLRMSFCYLFSVYFLLARLLRFAIDITRCPVIQVDFQRREIKKIFEGVSSTADFVRLIK